MSVVLTNDLADTIFSDPEQLLSALTRTFPPNFGSQLFGHQGVQDLLVSFVAERLDFGQVYAKRRQLWTEWRVNNKESFLSRFKDSENEGQEQERIRQESIANGTIVNPSSIKPRRLWDLYANRVIPYHYFHFHGGCIWAVSHSWTDDMIEVNTPINSREWPVPLPSNVSLDTVQTELLGHGARYAWLDVLCLRQPCSNPIKEKQRKDEWAIDLPTIGSVFLNKENRVLCYMNGLGRAFERTGWDHPRHWLRRAWTIQEIGAHSSQWAGPSEATFLPALIIGGVPEGLPISLDVKSAETGQTLGEKTEGLRILRYHISKGNLVLAFFMIIQEMRNRLSTNPVDKIAGITMLLRPLALPVYDESISEEDAWLTCIHHLNPEIWSYLLFGTSTPGDRGVAWRPSWAQLMDGSHRLALREFRFRNTVERVHLDGSCDVTTFVMPAQLTTFIPASSSEMDKNPSRGVWRLCNAGEMREFEFKFWEGSPVLRLGSYFLVGTYFEELVVCLEEAGRFRKLAVVSYPPKISSFLLELCSSYGRRNCTFS